MGFDSLVYFQRLHEIESPLKIIPRFHAPVNHRNEEEKEKQDENRGDGEGEDGRFQDS